MTKIEIGKTYKFLVKYNEYDLLTTVVLHNKLNYNNFIVDKIYLCGKDNFNLRLPTSTNGTHYLKATVDKIQFLTQTNCIIIDIINFSIID